MINYQGSQHTVSFQRVTNVQGVHVIVISDGVLYECKIVTFNILLIKLL